MAKKREGWEKKLWQGAPGAIATVQVVHATDIDLDAPVDYSDKTSRGDGTKVPHSDAGPVKQSCKLTFKMNELDGDASLIAFVAAASARTPTPRAILYQNPVTGDVFDGDMYIKYKDNGAMGAGGIHEFEGIPTTDGGREWLLNGE